MLICKDLLIETHSPPAECDWRSIFKMNSTDLNSDFFFSLTDCHIKVKNPNQLYYLPIDKGENRWIHTITDGISEMWSVQDLNSDHCVHFPFF